MKDKDCMWAVWFTGVTLILFSLFSIMLIGGSYNRNTRALERSRIAIETIAMVAKKVVDMGIRLDKIEAKKWYGR